MNNAADLVLRAEMNYRAERIQRAWSPVRRRRASRRQGAGATSPVAASVALG
jgi:hypothetical protein